MAAIEKIRKHSVLLLVIVGIALVAMIIMFAMGDANFGALFHPHQMDIAVVDGEPINVMDYQNQRDKNIERQKSMGNLTSAQTYSIYNNTLEEMIKNNIMTKEYEAAGMGITDEELLDQMTDHPHEWIVQNFSQGGNFDKQQVYQYLQNLGDLPAEYYDQWLDFEKAVKDNRLETKFNNLVKASYFLPTVLAQKFYENKNMKASADVIALRYASIPDSTVKVTDADNKAFYEENKSRYETDERRDIEYVVFEIKPSLEDRQDALKNLQEMRNDFASTDNVISFVNANSDKRYDSTWLGRKDVSELVEQAVFDGGNGVGFVYGPYEEANAFNMVRIVEMQNRPDSLKASHILIGYKGAYGSQDTISKEEAEAKANELLAQLKAAKNNDELFAEMAAQYNQDATKDKGGDLDWFTDGAMVPQFNQYVIDNPVGSLGVVETMFGYHVVKVTGKTQPQPKARLAYLTHEITSSTKTYQNVFAQANKFVSENRTYEQFNKAIEEQGLTKRTMPRMSKSTYQITGIEDPREIVRWAFDDKTKKGDVSDKVFELDNMFAVVALTGIVNEGYAPLEVVAEQSKDQIMNKKKGEMAVEKMKACGNDVNRMVNELGAESTTVSDVALESRVLGNFGVEADIVGTLLGMKEGEEVGPIAGNSSAFIIKNVRFTKPEATSDYSDIVREKTSQFTNKVVSGGIYNALRNNVKIQDYRTNVF